MNDQLLNYIKEQQDAGHNIYSIADNLVSSGWDRDVVNNAVENVMHEGSTVKLPTNSLAESNKQKHQKIKPPLAAQVLYAFGFLGLLFGLGGSVMLYLSASRTGLNAGFAGIFNLFGINLQLMAVYLAVITIGLFTLINYIRARKKWALVSYSTLIGLFTINTIYEFATVSSLEKALGYGPSPLNIMLIIIVVPLLLIIWMKNRHEFQ